MPYYKRREHADNGACKEVRFKTGHSHAVSYIGKIRCLVVLKDGNNAHDTANVAKE